MHDRGALPSAAIGHRSDDWRRLAADGRVAAAAGLVVLGILAIGLGPVLLDEAIQDWRAYAQAAEHLAAGLPLYGFDRAAGDLFYLYPPAMAAAWSVVGSPEALLVLGLLALAAVGVLAGVAVPRAGVADPRAGRRTRAAAAVVIAVAALIALPNLHDLRLGNVMALYVGAIAISVARPGWAGSLPLGLLLAVALKPAIGPYLVWLAIRRRADAGRVAAVALAATALTALAIGPERYAEYLAALPEMTRLATEFSGNAGLIVVSPIVAIVGLAAAYAVTVLAALRWEAPRAGVIAVAATLLAQPSLGFNYGGLLLIAVVLLWAEDRRVGLVAIVLVPIATVVGPPLGAAAVIALAAAEPVRRAIAAARRPMTRAASPDPAR